MKLTSEMADRFTMVNHVQLRRFTDQIGTRKLMPMDALIAEYLASNIDIQSGQIHKRVTDIAEDLGLQTGKVHQSIRRLRENDWLVKGLKGTGYFWMLDPWTWAVGKKETQAKRRAIYKKLMED